MLKRVMSIVAVAALLAGCGYSSQENEAIGQVQRVVSVTPIFCFNRTDVDLSLSVMRNGVGSTSTDNVWLTLDNQEYLATLKHAAETGALVKVTYKVQRVVWCWQDHQITKVELVQ